jgi:hypothetical protein
MWPDAAQLEDLVARFHARAVPKVQWTHAAHLAVGTWHVRAHGPDRALELLRSGISRLNDTHGTPNDDGGGYHETITRAYIQLLAEFLAARSERPTAACVQELLASPLAARDALMRYYSKALLMSVRARRGWVEPDLAPLRLG